MKQQSDHTLASASDNASERITYNYYFTKRPSKKHNPHSYNKILVASYYVHLYKIYFTVRQFLLTFSQNFGGENVDFCISTDSNKLLLRKFMHVFICAAT